MKMLSPSRGQQSKNSELFQLVNDVKAGKIDTKQRSIEMLQSMTAEQKQAINQMLPNILKLGKAFGVSDSNIQSFSNELKKILQRSD